MNKGFWLWPLTSDTPSPKPQVTSSLISIWEGLVDGLVSSSGLNSSCDTHTHTHTHTTARWRDTDRQIDGCSCVLLKSSSVIFNKDKRQEVHTCPTGTEWSKATNTRDHMKLNTCVTLTIQLESISVFYSTVKYYMVFYYSILQCCWIFYSILQRCWIF